MCMKKLLFLFLLSPLTYSQTYYCESNADDYLMLETNYWDMEKKNTKSRLNIAYGQTNTVIFDSKLKEFKNLSTKVIEFAPETIHENYFGVIAYNDDNQSIYKFNHITKDLTVEIYNPIKTNGYFVDKKRIGNGIVKGDVRHDVRHVYNCVPMNNTHHERREKIEQGQLEAPFK